MYEKDSKKYKNLAAFHIIYSILILYEHSLALQKMSKNKNNLHSIAKYFVMW